MHGIFRHVYETVQFAKLKLLARALERAQLFEGGRLVVSYLLKDDFGDVGAEEPYSEGIIDSLRAVEGSEMVALIREPPRDEGPARRISLRSSHDEVDVSAIARKAGAAATGRPRASRPSGRSARSSTSSAASSSLGRRHGARCRRALRPVGIALVDKPAGPSSFAIVATLRRRTRARTGHAGTLDPFATGLLVLLSGAATRLAPCFVGLDKRYVTDVDLTSTTTTGDPEGEVVERHPAPPRSELDEALARLRGEVELPIPAASAVKIGGERAYRLARRGVEVEMPLRRSLVHALDVITYSGDRSAVPSVRLELHVSSGTYVRAIANALGGHCTTLRRLAVGPFRDRRGRARGGCRAAAGGGCARPAAARGRREGVGARAGRRSLDTRRTARLMAAPDVEAAHDGRAATRQDSSRGGRARSRSAPSTVCTAATRR